MSGLAIASGPVHIHHEEEKQMIEKLHDVGLKSEYAYSQAVDAPAGQLFDYLSDVGTSPRLRRD